MSTSEDYTASLKTVNKIKSDEVQSLPLKIWGVGCMGHPPTNKLVLRGVWARTLGFMHYSRSRIRPLLQGAAWVNL